MKVRESGMPDEASWSAFFDAQGSLATLGCDANCGVVVEFGCGFGLFTVAAARTITGVVHALDIEPAMVERTKEQARSEDLNNIVASVRDFVAHGTGLAAESCDYAMLFNILHLENPVELLIEAWRVLKPGGRAGVMHWVRDASTPRGP